MPIKFTDVRCVSKPVDDAAFSGCTMVTVSLLPLWRGPGDTVVTGVVRIAQRLMQVSTRVISLRYLRQIQLRTTIL